MKLLLNTEEAAEALSVSLPTMKRLLDVSGGPVKTILIRRARRIPVQSLDEYIAEKLDGEQAAS